MVNKAPQNLPLFGELFSERPARLRLLKKGMEKAGWQGHRMKLLEAGCSVGDGAVFMAAAGHWVTGFDVSSDLIQIADESREKNQLENLQFIIADAADLPFPPESFEGIFMESAFSVMEPKEEILRECNRVLRPGGKILVNDYMLRNESHMKNRELAEAAPCLAGVQTRKGYLEQFAKAGMRNIYFKEEYGELIHITLWICKMSGIRLRDMTGWDRSFFETGKLSYCQMIYEK